MAKKYIILDRPIKDIRKEELVKKLEGLKQSELMRTIILNEKEFINIDYTRSLRAFWYSTVKPTLDKLGRLTEDDQTEEGLTKWDGELSRYMAQLVKEGALTYKDLGILDNSRQRKSPGEIFSVVDLKTYGYKIAIAPHPNIIISTEKDTVFNVIADIASFFGCSCISGKGQNSLGAMEDLLRKMGQVTKDIYILTITDYDPAGYYIAETFKNQVEDLRENLNIKAEVFIERIGITPEQLTPEEVEQNKYTPKPANIEKWLKATGGINGEAKGLELDALTPNRIRSLFINSIRKYIAPEDYKGFIKASYLQKIILEAIKPKIDNIVTDLIGKEIDSIDMPDFDLFELAKQGKRTIPVSDLCYSNKEDSIKEQALSYFM